MKCDYCKRSISGKYWQYENGRKICRDCRSRLPQCAACSIAVQGGISQRGKIFCPQCSRKLAKCHFCRAFLVGQYLRIGGLSVCADCARDLPRCVRCNMPVREYLETRGKALCLPCSRKVEHCAVCQMALLDKYHKFPGDSRKFCGNCATSRDRCDLCALPLTASYRRLQDNRSICENCLKEAVKTPEKAKEALAKVLAYLEKKFAMRIRKTTALQMVDSKALRRMRKNIRGPGQKDRRALGIFVRQGEVFEVYIESFLPYPLCLGVLAHEYTHAWQADHFPARAGILWVEGLAEWIAYRTLLFYGYKKQAHLITRQQDEYGQGFRKIQDIEHKYGTDRVIAQTLIAIRPGTRPKER